MSVVKSLKSLSLAKYLEDVENLADLQDFAKKSSGLDQTMWQDVCFPFLTQYDILYLKEVLPEAIFQNEAKRRQSLFPLWFKKSWSLSEFNKLGADIRDQLLRAWATTANIDIVTNNIEVIAGYRVEYRKLFVSLLYQRLKNIPIYFNLFIAYEEIPILGALEEETRVETWLTFEEPDRKIYPGGQQSNLQLSNSFLIWQNFFTNPEITYQVKEERNRSFITGPNYQNVLPLSGESFNSKAHIEKTGSRLYSFISIFLG